MNDDVIGWFSLENGTHVPIKKGESKRTATSKFLNKKMSRVQKNKNKYETIDRFKERKATNKFDKLKFNVSKDGNRYELNEEDRNKVMRKLNKNTDTLKKFDVSDDKTKYTMKKEERDKVLKKLGLHNYNDDEENELNEENDLSRREKLVKFTQENREQIKKWADEYDEETNRQAFEKAKRGEGLTAKEYFGFIGSEFKPGSVILEEFADGENAVVANDGNWVRESRIKEYNNNPRANQDAVYNEERENNLKWEKEERENPRISVEEMRKRFANQKNPFRDDEYTDKELEKERIEQFKRRKRTNK